MSADIIPLPTRRNRNPHANAPEVQALIRGIKGQPTEQDLADRLESACNRMGLPPRFSSPTLPRAQYLEATRVMQRWARDLGVEITVHPQGGVA